MQGCPEFTMPVYDLELESDLEVDVVLKIALHRDSPIYALNACVIFRH